MLLGMYPDDAVIGITTMGEWRVVLDRSKLHYIDGCLCLNPTDSLPDDALPIVRFQYWAFYS